MKCKTCNPITCILTSVTKKKKMLDIAFTYKTHAVATAEKASQKSKLIFFFFQIFSSLFCICYFLDLKCQWNSSAWCCFSCLMFKINIALHVWKKTKDSSFMNMIHVIHFSTVTFTKVHKPTFIFLKEGKVHNLRPFYINISLN